MAKKPKRTNRIKPTSAKTKQRAKSRDFKPIWRDPRFHLALGFFLIVTSLYLFIAQVSYLLTGAADQSVVESVLENNWKSAGQETENWLGLVGAIVSYLWVYRWFGIASLLIPPLLFAAGVQLVFRRTLLPLYRAAMAVAFFLIWISWLLGYWIYHQENFSEWSMLSGGVGYELAIITDSLIGWGTLLVLAFALIVFIIYFFGLTSPLPFPQAAASFERSSTPKSESFNDGFSQSPFAEEEEVAWEQPTVSPFSEEENPTEDEAPEEQLFVQESEPKSKKEKSAAPSLSLDIEDPELPSRDSEPEYALEVEEHTEEAKKVLKSENYDPTLDLPQYRYPEPGLLDSSHSGRVQVTKEELEDNKDRIVETLINFKIGIQSIKATIGPTVTLYEIVPEAGVKISKIKNLEDDIALNLAALGIRIIAPIPGKGTIGIEVPNKNRETVSMHSVVTTEKFMHSNKELPIILGKTVANELFVADLAKMPHLLIAGATGQGKSVGLNVLISSLIYKRHPSQLKFVMVDPKKVELSLFNKLERHFLAKIPNSEDAIITETKNVIYTLNSLCIEMDNRYNLLKDATCRNIREYNKKFVGRKLNPEEGHRFLPYIVLIIDELADLMMTAGKEVETPIARLAQLARAIGIHLVVATQRPSVNVITGIIKANFPVRLSYRVTSKVDSRTILDTGGAEQLVGMGDMLLSVNSDIIRLQCPFVDTPEVDSICEFIGSQRGYESAYVLPEYLGDEGDSSVLEVDLKQRDDLFDDAARVIVHHQQGSTSLIQRKLKLGYNRAGRLIDQLEAAGIVGPFEGSKAREVLISDEYSLEQLLNSLD
ncbi:FtsK/SpoIIIE family DNA translocase [Tunicatimonas pelagia]|uniref:FtsK/SpoIIIE family DNA translocase n=1 Tax=Tunicatimonas pelagia TaxID=931531 RepID=UPI002664F8D5|nr:DNA translocase FtsK [Tunicatimonas pelagia]WKN41416.1 DNA translocase FtsK [Tunicatimonas pelagia]